MPTRRQLGRGESTERRPFPRRRRGSARALQPVVHDRPRRRRRRRAVPQARRRRRPSNRSSPAQRGRRSRPLGVVACTSRPPTRPDRRAKTRSSRSRRRLHGARSASVRAHRRARGCCGRSARTCRGTPPRREPRCPAIRSADVSHVRAARPRSRSEGQRRRRARPRRPRRRGGRDAAGPGRRHARVRPIGRGASRADGVTRLQVAERRFA